MNTWRNLPGKIWVSAASLDPLLRRRARRAADGLSPAESELFLDMARYDLAHSLAVAARFEGEPVLLKAALLHDCGKLRSELRMPARWLYTWMELFLPSRLRRLGGELEREARGESRLERAESLPRGWRRGLYVQLHHGAIGARLLRNAGTDEEVVRLVGSHQSEPGDELSRRLAEVDDRL